MRAIIASLVLCFALGGCADKSCKNACDKLKTCGYKSNALACTADCTSPDADCAVCLNDFDCADLEAKCKDKCVAAVFTK